MGQFERKKRMFTHYNWKCYAENADFARKRHVSRYVVHSMVWYLNTDTYMNDLE